MLLTCSTFVYAIDASSGSPLSQIGSAPPPTSPEAVLYDQMDNPAGSDVTSQDFEASLDTYDDQAADDFVVPASVWTITSVDVDGEYTGTGPAVNFNVFFYANSGGFPGGLMAVRLAQPFTGTLGDASITLTSPVVLTAGTYWISVQAREDFGTAGQWFWGDRTPQASSPAAWENPGGGFGFGCASWGVRSTCVVAATGADQLFRLNGSANPLAWVYQATIPTDVYGSPTTATETLVYSGGGYSFSAGGTVQNFQSWNPDTNVWTPLAPLPDILNGLGSMVYGHNGKIYLFGGDDAATGTVTAATRIYTIATNTWSAGPNMPDVRAFMGAGYFNGSIYLAGGYSTGNVDPVFATLWRYDIATNTFDTSLAPVPVALGGYGSAILNGVLYLAGGRDINGIYPSLYGYNIAGNSWATLANMPSPDNVPGAAVFSGKLWVYGGGNPFLTSSSATELPAAPETTAACTAYDPLANSWSACPSLNVTRSFPGSTSVRNIPVAVGGYTGSSTTTAIEAYLGAPELFLDGFETGNTTRWSVTVP